MKFDGFDRWIHPIEIVTGANKIRISETAGATTTVRDVTLTVGTYWPFIDAAPSGYTSFWAHLISRLNTSSTFGATYSLELADPLLCDFGKRSSVRIKATGGTQDSWRLIFDVNFTAPHGLVGFAEARTGTAESAGNQVTGEITTFGSVVVPRCASMKERAEVHVQAKAGGRTLSAPLQRSHTFLMRRFKYSWIPGAHVEPNRGLYAGWANTAKLHVGDANNAFHNVWKHGLSKNKSVFVVHDAGHLNTDISSEFGYEIVRLKDKRAESDFRPMRKLVRPGGEFYDLEFEVEVVGGEYAF